MKLTPKLTNLIKEELGLDTLEVDEFYETDFSLFWTFKNTSWLLKKPKMKENRKEGERAALIFREFPEIAAETINLEDGYFLVERLYPLVLSIGQIRG